LFLLGKKTELEIKMKSFIVMCSIVFWVAGMANADGRWCRGQIPIPGTDFKVNGAIIIDDLSESKYIMFPYPITKETDMSYSMPIIAVTNQNGALRVIAADQNGLFAGSVVSFLYEEKNNQRRIWDFKGFEDEYPYGPATLTCQ
jgi:hypothetical protein